MRRLRAIGRSLVAIVAAVSLAAATPSSGGAVDPAWWDGFAFPGVDGTVYCAMGYRGGVAIGGRFSFVGEVASQNVAWWNGTRWEALDSGIDGDVLCLVADDDGLIAGGRFARAGGVDAVGVARWDGASWAPMGHGLDVALRTPPTGPRALGFYHDTLIAVGEFTRSGPTTARHAAWWNGATWNELGSGLSDYATSLAVVDDRLFVGGAFDSAGGAPALAIAQWDGNRWTSLDTGVRLRGTRGYVSTLAARGQSLVVAGEFDSAGAGAASNIASWEDGSWSPIGAGLEAPVYALAGLGDSIFVGGHAGLPYRMWDGLQWTYPATPPFGYAVGLATHDSGFLVFGDVTARDRKTGSPLGFKLLRRVGDNWLGFEQWTGRMHGLGPDAQVSALARTRAGTILAGGRFDHAGTPPQWTAVDGLAEWAGTHWNPLPPRLSRNPVDAILEHEDTLFVGGAFDHGSATVPLRSPVDRLVGGQWTHLDTLSLHVHSLVMYRGRLHAAGSRLSLSGPNAGGLYRWDGAHWEPIGLLTDSSPFPGIRATAEFEGRLVVGGLFESIGGIPATNMAAWDGERWEALGTALDNGYGFAVYGLAVHDTTLYASGDFGNVTGAVARWDGSDWQAVGGLRGIGLSIATGDTGLVACGSFQQASGVQEQVLAWDGSAWRSLGAQANGLVRSMLVDAAHVYLGGSFTHVGGLPSAGIARWDDRVSSDPDFGFALSGGRPNPFQSMVEFTYRLPTTTPIRVAVHDVLGRRVATLASGDQVAGAHSVRWDARDEEGRRLPAGIYLIRLSDATGRIESTKTILLP